MIVVVPVDFTTSSTRTASFAAQMLATTYGVELVLYHCYQNDNETESCWQHLQSIKENLVSYAFNNIRCYAEKGTKFIDTFSQFLQKEDAGLVITNLSDRIKLFNDSYSLQMISHSNCPVLVVPYNYSFLEIRNVALASDLKEVNKIIPVDKVRKVLNLFRPQIHIVHISSDLPLLPEDELIRAKAQLKGMFFDFHPHFHFITTENFAEGLDKFIDENDIDMVLTFPRKHSFISRLVKGTHTKKMVYKNSVPILAAHEYFD